MTESLQKLIEREAERFRDTLRASTSNVRPLGSTRVYEADQLEEFKLMQANPEVFYQFLVDQKATVDSAIRYAHKMSKRGKGVGETPTKGNADCTT